jgi:hypothetical protein
VPDDFIRADARGDRKHTDGANRGYSNHRTAFGMIQNLSTVVFAVAFVSGAAAQTLNPAPRAVIAQTRSLTQAEVVQILAAARDAVAGRTFKLSYKPDGPGPQVLMAANGRPRFVRSGTDLTEFTGRPARRCDGAPADGELVIEYRNPNDRGWIATARTRTPIEFATPVFDVLTGAIAVESGDVKTVGDRRARAFVAAWRPPAGALPGGELPPNLRQTLWIDVATLLPLRWEISAPTVSGYGMSFTYEALDIHAPDGVATPQCIS